MRTLQEAEDRIAELEGLLGIRVEAVRPSGIYPIGWKLLGLFVRRAGPLTINYLLTALYENPDSCPNSEVIRVHVHRLRKSLKKYGISIHLSHSVGYYMTPEDRAIAERITIQGRL